MLCPNCQKELIIVEHDGIELDYCISCNGFWFDHLEWNILAQKVSYNSKEDIGDLYSIPKAIVNEKERICPICGKTMEKFMYFDTVLDRCPDKCGVWFDKKEISEVINSTKNKKGAVVNFLGEVFYK